MVEPPKLWVERLDAKYRNRAPHMVRGYKGRVGEWFVADDMALAVGNFFGDRSPGRGLT